MNKFNIIDEIRAILRYIRRKYYLTFKREYVKRQLELRQGVCGKHGCCDLTRLGHFFSLDCLCWSDRTKCLRWDSLPLECYAYPFDEKDKHPKTKGYCNFHWLK